MHYVKLREIQLTLDVDESLLATLEAEELIQVKRTLEGDVVLSAADVDRLQVIMRLMRDLDVNLAGVEVILHMRDELLSMHTQFDEVLRSLVQELRKRVAGPSSDNP
jgi:MerR family transcriptional regulator/heat shock protein HspR